MTDIYWEHPVFLLYWVALKRKSSFVKWYDELDGKKTPMIYGKIGYSDPIEEALKLIKKYSSQDIK